MYCRDTREHFNLVAPLSEYEKRALEPQRPVSWCWNLCFFSFWNKLPRNRPSIMYLILNEWREYSLSTAVNGFHKVGYWKKRASIVWANPLGILYLLYLYELIDILLNGARPWMFEREIRILVCLLQMGYFLQREYLDWWY